MLASTLKVPVGETTYLIESPKDDGGLKATVTAIVQESAEAGTIDHIRHRDRLNLDAAKARAAFAAEAGTDPTDLLEVADRIREYLTPVANPAEEPPEPADSATVSMAGDVLRNPRLLEEVQKAVRASGYAGDLHNPQLLYLALTSRVTSRPINTLVTGPSSAGKNFVVDTVVALFPAAATYVMGAASERALVYTDADFQHRHVVISEASALHHEGIGALIMRCLVWGNQLDYEVTEQGPDGVWGTRRITKPGPTGLITTSVKGVEEELNTRLLTLNVADDEAATRDILNEAATRAAGGGGPGPDQRVWHEAQRWLADEGAHDVVIPFATDLAPRFPAKLVRARRDFQQLLALIKASAVLHQQQREQDSHGRIIASEADYRAVFALAEPVFGAAASDGVTPAIRETVAMVDTLTMGKDGATISAHALASALNIERSALAHRLKRAFRVGLVVNEEPVRGKPYKLRVGDPLPDVASLPKPELIDFGAAAPPEPSSTVQHPPENPHGYAETTIEQGQFNSPTVEVQQSHCSNGHVQQSIPHSDAEISELLNCSTRIRGGVATAFVEPEWMRDIPESDEWADAPDDAPEPGERSNPSHSSNGGENEIERVAAVLRTFTVEDLAGFRAEVAAAHDDDADAAIDRAALALLDRETDAPAVNGLSESVKSGPWAHATRHRL
jgi:hypothetical protein